jgi:acetoin utilization deacetylase AcuC-like enzyme
MSKRKIHVAFRPEYVHPLPENHRFPMEKYDLLPTCLLREGTLQESDFFEPDTIDTAIVEQIHDQTYLSQLFSLQLNPSQQRASGFVHNQKLIQREQLIMEGTRSCAERALESMVAMNIAGGTHHAFTDRGEGFCLLNDQAIAAEWLIKHTNVRRVLIVDLDVHQGNGTAEICKERSEVYTFSMHGKNNYPLKKEISDLDVELEDGTGDHAYLYQLEKCIDQILQVFSPDFVFYQCGVDVLETDKLGRISLSKLGCRNRDRMLFQYVRQLGVPVVCTMGGGYSQDIMDIVDAHANTFRMVQDILL